MVGRAGDPRILSRRRGRRTIARGERSEPLVRKIEIRAPRGRKAFSFNIFRPFRAPSDANSYQGFASLTPGYHLTAGLMHFCLCFSVETSSDGRAYYLAALILDFYASQGPVRRTGPTCRFFSPVLCATNNTGRRLSAFPDSVLALRPTCHQSTSPSGRSR